MPSPTITYLREQASKIQVLGILKGQRGRINCVAFSPDNRHLAIGASGVWLTAVEKESLRELPIPLSGPYGGIPKVTSIAFSPDGKHLAACDFESIHIWNLETEEREDRQPTSAPIFNCCAFSSDGKQLAWGSDRSFGWFTRDGADEKGLATSSRVNSIAFAGKWLAIGSDNSEVGLLNTTIQRLVSTDKAHSSAVTGVAFSPRGDLLASCSQDKTVAIYEAPSGKRIQKFQVAHGQVRAIAWSPDGNLLITRSRASNDGLCIWRWQSGEIVYSAPQLPSQRDDIWSPRALAVSSDGRLLASYPPETVEAIRLWDISPISLSERDQISTKPLQRTKSSAPSNDAIAAHLRTLPLTHATPPTPSRPASWLRDATVVGIRPPLFVVQDLGTLITQSKPQLARPKFLPPDIDTSSYFQFLTRLSSQPLLRQVSGWELSDSMVGVILSQLLDGVGFPEEYAAFNSAEVVPFARNLAVELDRADAEHLWRNTDPARRPSVNALLPADARAKVETNLRRLDADELRFMHQYGPRFAGAPDPRDLLDLFSLLDLPPGVQHSLTQMLRLIPRISQCKTGGGAQTYAMGGYAGLTNKGNLDSLVPTELAYPEEMLLYRLLNQEALYYGRETERERSRELIYIVTQAGLDLLGDGDVLARALTLALAQTLQRRGYEVQQSFVGSTWTEPSTMLRPADVHRVLYHRDKGSLRAKAMLEAVLVQLRAWSERYRSMQVMWVVGEHWDTDDLDNNRDLYNAVRQEGDHQAWFIRMGNGKDGELQRYPPAARQFKQHQIISSDLMWVDIKPPERMFVQPDVADRIPEPPPEIRYDGVYMAELGNDRLNVLRFYEDGTVVSGFFVGTVVLETIHRWLRKDFPSASTGSYSINRSGIEFKVVANGRVGEYSGVIMKDQLRLELVEYTGTTANLNVSHGVDPNLEGVRGHGTYQFSHIDQ
jgi:hypothetical protein